MKWKFSSYLLLLLFVAVCCDKEEDSRMDDFFLDFATVKTTTGKTHFVLDNFRALIPNSEPTKQMEEGQRVGINYTPLRGDTIKVNSISEIYTGQIEEAQGVDNVKTDPISIQSVWVGGNHLNFIFYVEYYDKPHHIELLHDVLDDSEIVLHFSHSRNDDSPGYKQKMYASYHLGNIQSSNGGESVKFKLKINTTSGLKEYEFEVVGKQ